MKSKGAATSLIALSVLLFIASGNIFGALVIDGNIMEQVSYNRGDYPLIAETKVKKDLFPKRVAAELNYTSNNAALSLDGREGDYSEAKDISWSDNIPSDEDLRTNYYTAIEDRISDQKDILECEEPEITDISKPAAGDTTEFETSLSQKWVKCSRERSEVSISLGIDKVRSNNINNRYVDIVNYAPVLGTDARNKAEDAPPITGEGDDDGNSCPEDRNEELGEAESEARPDALSGYNSMGEKALGDTSGERPDWINADSTTSFEGTTSSSITDSTSCQYDCETNEDGDRVCSSGTLYDAEATYEANEVRIDYSLADGQREVINSEAEMENIEFEFTYEHSLD